MNLIKCCLAALLLLFGCISVSCGKLKFVARKGPFGGFIGLKYRKPKLLGFGHHGLGFGHGLGGGFGHGGFGHGGGYGGYHTHHEFHESHHSSGGFGGWLGK